MSQQRHKCCIANFYKRRKDVSFHKFPISAESRQNWLKCIACDRLRSLSFEKLQKLYICGSHFEDKFYYTTSRGKRRLCTSAYPTIFTCSSDIASGVPQRAAKILTKKIPVSDHNYSKKQHFDHNYCKKIESCPKKILKPTGVENNILEHEQNNILEFDKNYLLEQDDSETMQHNDKDKLEHDENIILDHDEKDMMVRNEHDILEHDDIEILEPDENDIHEHDENEILEPDEYDILEYDENDIPEHAESDIMEYDESEIEIPISDVNLSSSLNGDIYKTAPSISDPLGIALNDVPEFTPTIDPEHLKALEDCHTEVPEWFWNDTKIIDEIAHRWEPILKNGLKKEVKEEIYNYYFFAKKLPCSKPPIINPEIASLLTEKSINRDNELVDKQRQLGHALTAIGTAMTGLLTNAMKTSDVLKTLNDAGKLIADLHYAETETRRSHFTPELDRFFVEPLKERVRDDYLFGQELNEFVKPSSVKPSSSKVTPCMISTLLNDLNARRVSRRQSYVRKKRDGVRLRHSVYTLSVSRPQRTAPVKSMFRPLDFPTEPRPRPLTEQNEIELHAGRTKQRLISSDSKVIAVTSLQQPCQRSVSTVLYDGT